MSDLTCGQLLAILFAVAAPLSVCFIALIGRLNGQTDED